MSKLRNSLSPHDVIMWHMRARAARRRARSLQARRRLVRDHPSRRRLGPRRLRRRPGRRGSPPPRSYGKVSPAYRRTAAPRGLLNGLPVGAPAVRMGCGHSWLAAMPAGMSWYVAVNTLSRPEAPEPRSFTSFLAASPANWNCQNGSKRFLN